jgi:basic membrane protein A
MLRRKLFNLVLLVVMLVTLGVNVANAAPPAQEEVTYTVKLGDNLWTLAEKYLGSGPVYRAIVMATNAKNLEDPTFATISNPNLIHPGWKFLIPSAEEAEKLMATWRAGAEFKVGQVTDMGGIDDKSFNQTAWKGIQDAINQFGVQGKYLESQQQADYAKNIQQFLGEKLDFIVTVGFLLGVDTATAAIANPAQKFAIVDYAYPDCWPGAVPGKDCGSDKPLDNVLGLTFATDEAAFLAGYLAAGMTKTGKVGTFGGIKIPTVTIFMKGLEAGVKYYNQKYGTKVAVLGWETAKDEGLFTGNFESTDDGRRFAESLMDEGADIILPVAGPVGLGSAAACKERGTMLIGVDTDWYITAPEFKETYLTSIVKRMDVTVFDAVKTVMDGTFKGGAYLGTLKNGGVGITSFHEFDAKVPAALKSEIEQAKKDLIAGTITVDGVLKGQ